MIDAAKSISHETAVELATRLRAQGRQFADIARILADKGYVSPGPGSRSRKWPFVT